MNSSNSIITVIKEQAVLPLFFHKDAQVCIDVIKALYSAGIKAVEFTNRGEAALANFKAIKKVKESEFPGLFLGIGTIKNRQQAKDFIEAGADFLVSPGVVIEVAEEAKAAGVPYAPGCMTPTEIIAAENLGLQLVKIFPGNVLGTGFIGAIKELFPNVSFMVTGGVEPTAENMGGWFKAGVAAVGMGSKLITKQVLEQKNYAELAEQTKQLLELIKTVK